MRDNIYNPTCCTDELFAGGSAVIRRLRLQAERIARHFRIALLTGERGTGKCALAHELHKLSAHGAKPFVIRPAAALANGDIELDTGNLGGTLYLHDVQSLTLDEQERLLTRLRFGHGLGPRQVLDGHGNVDRFIFGSTTGLRGLVAVGRMKPELQSRIGTLELCLPSLRERLEDLEAIAGGMLRQMNASGYLSPAALAEMRKHSWPGNLAELRKHLVDLRNLHGVLEPRDLLPLALTREAETPLRLDEVMHRHVVEVLQRCAGNKLRAAELLGISRSTLYRMLESTAA